MNTTNGPCLLLIPPWAQSDVSSPCLPRLVLLRMRAQGPVLGLFARSCCCCSVPPRHAQHSVQQHAKRHDRQQANHNNDGRDALRQLPEHRQRRHLGGWCACARLKCAPLSRRAQRRQAKGERGHLGVSLRPWRWIAPRRAAPRASLIKSGTYNLVLILTRHTLARADWPTTPISHCQPSQYQPRTYQPAMFFFYFPYKSLRVKKPTRHPARPSRAKAEETRRHLTPLGHPIGVTSSPSASSSTFIHEQPHRQAGSYRWHPQGRPLWRPAPLDRLRQASWDDQPNDGARVPI